MKNIEEARGRYCRLQRELDLDRALDRELHAELTVAILTLDRKLGDGVQGDRESNGDRHDRDVRRR